MRLIVSRYLCATKLACLVAVSWACATQPRTPIAEPRQPIQLSEPGSQPILFEKVIVRLPAGAHYGAVYLRSRREPIQELVYNSKHIESEEFNILVTDRMAELGYDAVDPTDAVFTPDSTVRARFRLVGVITKLQLDTWRENVFTQGGRQTADLVMDVRLYDAAVKGVVYERTFSGRSSDEGSMPAALPAAVLNAVDGALSDPEFVERVSSRGSARSSPGEAIRLPACDAGIRLPAAMSKASRAVVTIRQGHAVGSGVIVSPEGHVLTAAHVARVGDDLGVTLESGIELAAEVQRVDALLDVALLKIPGSRHHCIPLDLGAQVGKGHEVFAIGAPLDERLAGSVTRGIVSGRPTIEGQELLQTDASVNQGNSGGPLVDEAGTVVGLVVGKFFGIGVEGVGFAVPTDRITETLGIAVEPRAARATP
jgi:S1-C subfamily serine protease